jgi:hypothetical protein
MKRTSRTPCKLSDSLHHRLNAYALAASAAGVSLLALAQPAEAKIVYKPAHVTFGAGAHGPPPGSYYLDLNRDGIPDFVFRWAGLSMTSCCWVTLHVQPTGSNGVAGNYYWVYCLGSGASIGPQQFFAGTLMASIYFEARRAASGFGSWYYPETNGNVEGYLGLKFGIHGQTHYGWARLNVFTNHNAPALTAALLGYAYETMPNKPIILSKEQGPCQRLPKDHKHANPASSSTAEPASLGRLAQGASGVAAWRRKELTGTMTK